MSNQEEIWEDVPGYEGKYQISNFGRVKSIMFKRNFIKKVRLLNMGYYGTSITISKNNIKKHKILLIHRLVALAFIKNTDSYKIEVNHINGIKTDNGIENLEWVTPSENQKHSVHVLGNKSYVMASEKSVVVTRVKVSQLNKNGEVINTFNSVKEAGEYLNLKSNKHISSCCTGKRKTAYGYKWTYA